MSLNTILATAPLTATGYHLKATGTALGQSLIWDNGTNVGIGNTNTSYTLDVSGTGRFTSNVGIGATLSAWISTAKALQLNNTASLFAPSSEAILGNNIFVDSTDNNKYITTNYASQYRQVNGQHIFYTAASGTAGNTISFTTAMTITSAGNVGIGTSSPSSLLQVYGTGGSNPNAVIQVTGTTNYAAYRMNNTGGDFYIGIENSTGTGFGTTAYGRVIFADGAYPLIMFAAGIERMRITSGGQIYTSNAPLGDWSMRVIGNSTAGQSFGFKVLGGTNSADLAFSVTPQNGSTNYFFIRGDGYMFSSPTYNNLWAGYSANTYVAGDGSFGRTTPSSIRYKDNINEWSGKGLETILALKPKTFKYKKEYCESANIDFLGLIAEEVAEVLPYLAQYENPDRTGLVENVRYDTIVVPLIAAIQEQQIQIQNLQEQINILAK